MDVHGCLGMPMDFDGFRTSEDLYGFERIWADLGGFGRIWTDLDGWFGVVLAGLRWSWKNLDGFGWT